MSDYKDFGLTKNEILIYLYIVENGGQSVLGLNKIFKLSRTGLYSILKRLIGKKLIKKKNNAYYAENPTILYNKLISQENIIQHQKKSLAEFIQLYNKPKIRVYRGDRGYNALVVELRKEPIKEGYIILNADFLPKKLISRRSKEKFKDDIIINFTNKSKKGRKTNKNEFFLKYKHQKTLSTISIFGKRVAICSFPLRKENYGILIEDENIANLFKDIIKNLIK